MATGKKLKSQLFLALIMLLAGIFALGGATYAWFSLNDRVTAKGITINSKAEGVNFEITTTMKADGVTPDFGTGGQIKASANLSAKLLPTHPIINGTATVETRLSDPAKWYHAFSTQVTSAQASNPQDLLDTHLDTTTHTIQDAEGKKYALVATYYVRINPDSAGSQPIYHVKATDLKVTSKDTAVNADFIQCTNILVVGKQGAQVLTQEAPDGDQDLTGTIAVDGTPKRIDVYAYFEGTHENCRSDVFDPNAIDIEVIFKGYND